jgi:CubicO group peptidase (beta-lactamase class C family)
VEQCRTPISVLNCENNMAWKSVCAAAIRTERVVVDVILAGANEFDASGITKVIVRRPLNITDFEWEELPVTGQPAASAGLRLRPRDTAKLGQLMLNRGRWSGRWILPEDWAAESVKPRINVSASTSTAINGGLADPM